MTPRIGSHSSTPHAPSRHSSHGSHDSVRHTRDTYSSNGEFHGGAGGTRGGYPADVPDAVRENSNNSKNGTADCLNTISSILDGIGGFLGGVFDVIGQLIPGKDLFEMLSEALDNLRDADGRLNSVLDEAEKAIHGAMLPWLMPDYAAGWHDVANALREAADILGPTHLRNPSDGRWTGEAAEGYRTRAAEQVETANFAADMADEYGDYLDALGADMRALANELLSLVIEIVTAVISMIGEFAGVVTIPAAVLTFIDIALPVFTQIFSTLDKVMQLVSDAQSTIDNMAERLESAQEYFPGGNWRKVTA